MSITVLKMPSLSMTMVEGVVVKWHKEIGDMVQRDEPLLDVETDKVVKEMTAPATGRLAAIHAKEMEVVPVGNALCEISTAGAAAPETAPARDAIPPAAAPIPPPVVSPPPAGAVGIKVKSSPLARRVAADLGVDYTRVAGTGPGGLIVKRDIEKAAGAGSSPALPTSAPDGLDEVIPFSGIRRRIADVMMKSVQNTATVSAIAEVNMAAVAEYRKYVPVSYTAWVVAAVSRALADPAFRVMNSQLSGDDIIIKGNINISVSVATGKGLMTPVIRNADQKNILAIGGELAELAARARDGGLDIGDLQGGTFTVTNSGVFGSLLYTPIINYPQAGIIGMGKIMKTPVVIDDEIVIAPMMYLCISYDHRLIDGGVGAPFLQRVKHHLEHPQELVAPGKENNRK